MLTAELLEGPHTYGDLLARVEPSPINSRSQYEEYLGLVEDLMVFVHRNPDREPYQRLLDLVAQLVEHYEESLVDENEVEERDPAELLRHILDSRSMTQAELARLLDVERSTVNNVLRGGRKVPAAWAKTLSEVFELPAEWFLEARDPT